MGRLWKTSVLLILAILVLTKDDQHSLSSFAMTTSVHAAADSDSSIVGPDMLAYSGQHHHDSSARRRRFNAQPRLTLDEEDDFMALVEAELKYLGTQKLYITACYGSLLSPRHILAFHHELTEAYLQEIYGDIYALTGYRIKAPFESSTPVLLSHLSAVIPFPGAIAADQSNVNSYFNNSFAMIELPADQALASGNGVGFIRVSIDVDGSILAATTSQISVFAFREYYGSIGKVDEATVSGTQCNPTSLILVAGGELNTKSAACISMRSEPGLCGKIPVGSAVVVLGADNNQYLVALTRFGADCNGTHAGVSLAFPSHKDFICSFSDVNCSNALPAVPTTTQNPTTTIVLMNATTTTQNSVLTTSNSINTNNTTITTTQTIQARTTDAQGSNGDGSNQDRPNQSKFWSILRLLIDAFAGQGK